jgi:hypothetical protein
MSYLDATPDQETQVSLIKTLQTVTEGKVMSRSCSILQSVCIAADRIFWCSCFLLDWRQDVATCLSVAQDHVC